MSRLLEALHSGRVLLMDGAMGTELQRRGLKDGEPPELWNLTHPEEVRAVHRAYVEAGAEILVTNTFQADPASLQRRGLKRRMKAIWDSALKHARSARKARPIVLADVGPCEMGNTVRYGALLDTCRRADGLLLETWNWDAPEILHFSVFNRRWYARKTPFLVSIAFGRTAGKRRRAEAATVAFVDGERQRADALGVNCGKNIDMDDILEIVRAYRDWSDLPIFIRPNAGTPRRTTTGWKYPRSPEYMADKLWPLLEAGVTMVGGCCGTTPAHIAAFRKVIDEWNARNTSRPAPQTPRRG